MLSSFSKIRVDLASQVRIHVCNYAFSQVQSSCGNHCLLVIQVNNLKAFNHRYCTVTGLATRNNCVTLHVAFCLCAYTRLIVTLKGQSIE